MKYRVLATDYDGTLATDGVVGDDIVATLRRARERGLKGVLVTGRELPSLFNTFAHADVFELVVAENGAVLYTPATKSVEVIAPPPPPALVRALEHAGVPVAVGHSIVATVLPHDQAMRAVLQSLDLDWHIVYNKRSAMAMPAGVTKATGLGAALEQLQVAAAECIAVGDAENDLDFMQLCGLSVAVDNALPDVKRIADVVLTSARGAGVIELVTRLLAGDFA
jgi:hydroxymethylpyrimidine pyrophosphatase-like HAD family hydrolase